jgi:hypothetical protein
VTVGFVVTVAALSLFARGKEETQRRLDRWSSILFPAAYLAVLVAVVWWSRPVPGNRLSREAGGSAAAVEEPACCGGTSTGADSSS